MGGFVLILALLIAIILAIRFQSAIFTTEEVIKEVGIIFTDESDNWEEEKQSFKKQSSSQNYES